MMNALAAAALALLALSQDPRAFRMPKKATPPKAVEPAPTAPTQAPPAADAPTTAPKPAITFAFPKTTPPPEPAAPAVTPPPATPAPSTKFVLPNEAPRRKKPKAPRPFELPKKNVSN